MNKQELIDAISEKADLSKVDAKKALEATIATITDTLKAGGDVALIGFGTFKVAERSARTGRNPQTGAEIQIKASKVPQWKAGSSIKSTINN